MLQTPALQRENDPQLKNCLFSSESYFSSLASFHQKKKLRDLFQPIILKCLVRRRLRRIKKFWICTDLKNIGFCFFAEMDKMADFENTLNFGAVLTKVYLAEK